MDRLTGRCDFGLEPYYEICFLNPEDPEGAYNLDDIVEHGSDELKLAIAERIAAYEDTGRHPDEIAALDHDVAMLKQSARLSNELSKENARLRKALADINNEVVSWQETNDITTWEMADRVYKLSLDALGE